MMNEIAEPFGPPNGSTAPASACSASVVGWPSGSMAHPSGIAFPVCAATMIFPRATTLVDASKISGLFAPRGNADGDRIGAEEARPSAERRHVRRRVRNRQADAARHRSPSRRSRPRGRNDCCAGRPRSRCRASRARSSAASIARAPTTGPRPLSPSINAVAPVLAATRISGRAFTTPAWIRAHTPAAEPSRANRRRAAPP